MLLSEFQGGGTSEEERKGLPPCEATDAGAQWGVACQTEACKKAIEAWDDDVIGCVSKASPLCCDAVSHLTGASSLHSHATPRAHSLGTGSDAGFPFDPRNRSTATSDCRAPSPTAVAARRS